MKEERCKRWVHSRNSPIAHTLSSKYINHEYNDENQNNHGELAELTFGDLSWVQGTPFGEYQDEKVWLLERFYLFNGLASTLHSKHKRQHIRERVFQRRPYGGLVNRSSG